MCRRSEHRTIRTEAEGTGHPFGYTPAMGRVLKELPRNDTFAHSTKHRASSVSQALLQIQLQENYVVTEYCGKLCNVQDNLRTEFKEQFTFLQWDEMERKGLCS